MMTAMNATGARRKLWPITVFKTIAILLLASSVGFSHAKDKNQAPIIQAVPSLSVSLTITPASSPNYVALATVDVQAEAFDNDGNIVTQIKLYNNNVLITSINSDALVFTLSNLSAGSYTIKATATNDIGATASKSQTITITAPTNAPPTVSLTSPANGQTFITGNVVPLTASAADSDGTVGRVEFYVDGSKVGEDTTSPYSLSWTSTAGSHNIYARAVDNASAATNSGAVTITVNNPPPNVAPAISLTSPTSGQTFTTGNVVTLSANASDSDGSVARVEFYVDNVKVGEDAASPYTLGWTSTVGSHSVYARAVDNVGATASSAAVSITVSDPLPPVPPPGTYSKTETITYHDNTTKWVLGQTATVTCAASVPASTACDGDDVVSSTTYDPTTALPLTTSSFGKLQSTMAYNADGTLATVKDGLNHTTTFSNWKRGIPQTIQYADSTSQSAEVNDNGWITSVTDELSSKTCYGYDAMGRLASITYPSETQANVCDTSKWTALARSFVPVAAVEYGIPAGHWRETVTTGNATKLTYYDAMWRPLLVREYDAGNVAATERFTKTAYDAEGRVSFAAYPVATVTSAAQQAGDKGVTTFYDVLGRVTSVSQDSELGLLTTTTTYNTGFTTTVTSPRGPATATTTSYMTYDQPSTDWPLTIAAPESASTTIARDPHGKPLSLTRSGGGVTPVVRTYAYNGYQELCRSEEPETGATLFAYDAAGNLASSAAGLPLGTACGTANSRTVTRTYDARNRLSTLSFPDGNGNQTWTHYADGQPQQVVTLNDGGTTSVTNAYSYNKRRMLTGESISQPGTGAYTWSLGYGYNSLGQLATQSYPTGLMIDYAPNALGQATQAVAPGKTYASGASYYPNGALKQFTYGNGIVHTMTQNARQLPNRSQDSGGVLNAVYNYDANGNVDSIIDELVGAGNYSTKSRWMTYDGLDRLTGAGAGMFGGTDNWHRFTYDALDNLTSWKLAGVKDYATYTYSNNRLTSIQNTAGSSVVGLTYDVQGNLANKNGQGYVFDYGNRLRSATGKETYRYDANGRRVQTTPATGKTTLWQYSQAGQMLFSSDFNSGMANQQTHEQVYLAGSVVAIIDHDWPSNTVLATKYQHTDALGSPVAVTDQAGTVIDRTDWEPYGAAIGKPAYGGIGYTGHVMDGATGLTYMQQRYFDPQIGRFLSVDPVTAYSSGDLRHFNVYAYAFNNPYRFTDSSGMSPGIFTQMVQQVIRLLFPTVAPANNNQNEQSDGPDPADNDGGGSRENPRPGRDVRRGRDGQPINSATAPPPPNGDDDNDDKPKLVTNEKHHPNSKTPEPKNVQQLYDRSIADRSGVRWAKDESGVIHRFSRPSNGETHWNGSTGTTGRTPIQTRNIPNEVLKQLNGR